MQKYTQKIATTRVLKNTYPSCVHCMSMHALDAAMRTELLVYCTAHNFWPEYSLELMETEPEILLHRSIITLLVHLCNSINWL